MRRMLVLIVGCLVAVGCTNESPIDQAGQPSIPAIELASRFEEPPVIRVVEPANNAVVESPFVIGVEAENLQLAPAGRTRDGEGHWHVLVDEGCLNPGTVIPKDETHFHVGSGEAFSEIDLPPGEHQLCVQVGDGFHVAVAITDTITVTVVE